MITRGELAHVCPSIWCSAATILLEDMHKVTCSEAAKKISYTYSEHILDFEVRAGRIRMSRWEVCLAT